MLTVLDRTSRFFDAFPMAEATSAQCAAAFTRGWCRRFGVPSTAQTDNGTTFISNLWRDLHKNLGTIITYSPVYRAAAIGHVERQHQTLKNSLRAALIEMSDTHKTEWMSILHWVILGKNTTFQPDLGATPAELVFGCNPQLPGEVAIQPESEVDVPKLLKTMKAVANKKPVQTSHHTETKTNFPPKAENAELVYVKKQKRTPLDPKNEGPYPVLEKVGKSCLKVQVGTYNNGNPRSELMHWSNCQPANMAPDTNIAQRAPLGRRPKQTLNK